MNKSDKNIWILDVHQDQCTLVDFLHQHTGLSKQKIKSALSKGSIRAGTKNTTKRIRQAKKRLYKGQVVEFYYAPDILAQSPPPATLIDDLGDYSLWYKPSGMYSQGSKWGDHCTLYRWAEQYLQRPAFVVNRLDRAAQGLMLLAHNKKTARYFSQIFVSHAIIKHYRARVSGEFGTKQQIITQPIDNKPALSIIRQLDYDPQTRQSLLEIEIKTGRKHQIRKHLAAIGFAIIGDRLYGNAAQDAPDLQLYSYSLEFFCPLRHTQQIYTLPEKMAPGCRTLAYSHQGFAL